MVTTFAADSAAAPTPFTLQGTQLLSSGQSMALLARTPRLWAHIKVYADGGENGLHAHADEDHLFVVLAGEATFRHGDGTTRVAGQYDGLMIPRGVAYAFQSTGSSNLVILRVGCDATDAVVAAAADQEGDEALLAETYPTALTARVGPTGRPFPATDRANRSGAHEGVPVPGAFFPDGEDHR